MAHEPQDFRPSKNADPTKHDRDPVVLERVQELTWALVDEQITDDEMRLLDNLLLSDDEARGTYIGCMQLHTDLMDHFAASASAGWSGASSNAGARLSERSCRCRRADVQSQSVNARPVGSTAWVHALSLRRACCSAFASRSRLHALRRALTCHPRRAVLSELRNRLEVVAQRRIEFLVDRKRFVVVRFAAACGLSLAVGFDGGVAGLDDVLELAGADGRQQGHAVGRAFVGVDRDDLLPNTSA